jgi:mannitol operon transcriptional antiterminator
MFISDRTKEIIEYLMNSNRPVTVSDIAKELKVTERTIYRQMEEVGNMIRSFDLELDNSSGKGMQIFGSLYNIRRLSEAFEEAKKELSYTFTAKERTDFIILKLINEDDYIKTQAIAIDMDVSLQTIRNDYNNVKQKVQKYGIEFESKKSEGVCIKGKEISKRHVAVNLFLKEIPTDVFFDWMKGTNEKQNPFIYMMQSFGYEKILIVLYQKIQPLIRQNHITISDVELQEFLLLLTIFIKRHDIIQEQKANLTLKFQVSSTENEFEDSVCQMLNDDFHITLCENETAYFHWMINLYSSRMNYKAGRTTAELANLEQISDLVGKVEEELEIPFGQDENLIENLTLHLNMAIGRMQNKIHAKNPMLDDIYHMNPQLYEIVKKCVIDTFGIDFFPEDEIGYIVIYFLTFIDDLSKKSVAVLVVCSTGIGLSKMLKSRLEREFSEINVKKTISLHKVYDEDLKAYDLIITTVPLDIESDRCLCVSPLLNDEEKSIVRKRIELLSKKGE